ncbi:MAG: TolC family protein [Gammaproteobacteria bacterium]|nr:TolC family protein [Gammaproteobacteria bacterium]
MKAKGFFLCLIVLLTGCAVTPAPIPVSDRFQQAQHDVKELFTSQDNLTTVLDFNQALARGLKYNLDYRIKLVNNALQAGQLTVAEMTMFPSLTTTGSLYKRNNAYASFGITPNGQPTDVLTSTPNTIRSLREGLSWNILDFGVSYVKAKQQGDRVVIAKEESRKQLQQLAQDIRIAYWKAYSAQQLFGEVLEFQKELNKAKINLEKALRDKTVPKEEILNYQGALLQSDRSLIQLKYKLDKATLDLKHLLNIPLDQKIVLAPPPNAITNIQDLSDVDFRKLDAITLVNRPELSGQNYQKHIAELGVKLAIVQALHGITLNEGWNYNSNKFLINRTWIDRSIDVSWNLLNLASLPANYEASKLQIKYEQLKLMALTLTVLTETRYAFAHYDSVSKEYLVAHKLTENANALYTLMKNRQRASLASEQQVIIAKLHAITAKMDENLVIADVSTAIGELYISAGFDILPLGIAGKSVAETTAMIKQNFQAQNIRDFKSYVNNTYDELFKKSKPYTLQVFGSYDLATIKNLRKQLNIAESQYGQTKHNGHDWYVLTYGKYASSQQANTDIHKLPEKIRKLSPWVRNTEDVRWIG